MTTSPAEPVDNDQSGSDDSDTPDSSDQSSPSHDEATTEGIDDDQLPEDLRPGPDNPLASEDGAVSEAPKPGEGEDAQTPEDGAPPA